VADLAVCTSAIFGAVGAVLPHFGIAQAIVAIGQVRTASTQFYAFAHADGIPGSGAAIGVHLTYAVLAETAVAAHLVGGDAAVSSLADSLPADRTVATFTATPIAAIIAAHLALTVRDAGGLALERDGELARLTPFAIHDEEIGLPLLSLELHGTIAVVNAVRGNTRVLQDHEHEVRFPTRGQSHGEDVVNRGGEGVPCFRLRERPGVAGVFPEHVRVIGRVPFQGLVAMKCPGHLAFRLFYAFSLSIAQEFRVALPAGRTAPICPAFFPLAVGLTALSLVATLSLLTRAVRRAGPTILTDRTVAHLIVAVLEVGTTAAHINADIRADGIPSKAATPGIQLADTGLTEAAVTSRSGQSCAASAHALPAYADVAVSAFTTVPSATVTAAGLALAIGLADLAGAGNALETWLARGLAGDTTVRELAAGIPVAERAAIVVAPGILPAARWIEGSAVDAVEHVSITPQRAPQIVTAPSVANIGKHGAVRRTRLDRAKAIFRVICECHPRG